jgi:hypothetical protein
VQVINHALTSLARTEFSSCRRLGRAQNEHDFESSKLAAMTIC